MSDSPPLLVLMGPTASGKSALALEAARHLDGEIISVDSMQLYRGLEIGTAQPTREEQRAVPHHLVGEFDFHTRIDVFQFCRLAERAIEEIRSRNRLPILAGGTGFYLKALLYGIDDLPADRQLRTELDEQYDSEAGEILLQDRMHALDPAALQRWGKCRRRLIRALEVRLLTGKSILELQQNPGDTLRYAVRAWKLEIPPQLLAERIVDPQRDLSFGFRPGVDGGQMGFQLRIDLRPVEAVKGVAALAQLERTVEKEIFRLRVRHCQGGETEQDSGEVLHIELPDLVAD